MNRVGGVKATCDHEGGCGATLQVPRGDDTRWTLEWAGWQMTYTDRRNGEVWILCPEHHLTACTEDLHLNPHKRCILR